MPGWYSLPKIIESELIQGREEGRDLASLEALAEEARRVSNDAGHLADIHARMLQAPISSDYPFQEPNSLEEIQTLRAAGQYSLNHNLSEGELLDRVYGAWLGRCAGCALGKPVEAFMDARAGLSSWQRQKLYLTAISPGEWPLRDYIPGHSPAGDEAGAICICDSVREKISYMESDDDIRYTVLGQKILSRAGVNFTTWDVALEWISQLPYTFVCTAETAAFRNLILCYEFHVSSHEGPQEVDWMWVATHQNPFREWIGAQIRVDSYGYAAPSNPALAAEMAWRDARLSHVKNGLYGAMLCAAMIAASFGTEDVRCIIEAGLAQIPSTSRLFHELRQVVAICEKHRCRYEAFEEVIAEVYALLGHYNPIHTNNNAALCVMALLLSGGDFTRGITLAVMGGWDTDCNGATVGSIVGAIAGARRVPNHWSGRLNDTLNSQILGYHPIAISECARRSADIARKILGQSDAPACAARA